MHFPHTLETSQRADVDKDRHESRSARQDDIAPDVRPFPVHNWAWAASGYYDWMDLHVSSPKFA